MTAKKQKEKERRRARKLADQAWDAAHDENLDLAGKIIRRAVAIQPDNPVLWNDQGILLGLQGKEADAEASFRAALSLAPDFAEPHAHLAAIRVRQGLVREAVGLQARAVKLDPSNAAYGERLEAYRSLVARGTREHSEDHSPPANPAAEAPSDHVMGETLATQLTQLNAQRLGDDLTREGYTFIPRLLQPETCSYLAGLFNQEPLFAKTVVMD